MGHTIDEGEPQYSQNSKGGLARWPPPTVGPCSRERGLLWLIHLTLALHLFVFLHHFLLHLLSAQNLIVENDVEKRTVNLQFIASVIINESQFSELVHEEANTRASSAYHLCKGFLTHYWG